MPLPVGRARNQHSVDARSPRRCGVASESVEEDAAALLRENSIVLCVLQALIGAVSPNYRWVTVEFLDSGDIRVHLVLREERREDREEIEEELPTEVEVLTLGWIGDIGIEPVIHVGDELGLGDLPGRPVFGARRQLMLNPCIS